VQAAVTELADDGGIDGMGERGASSARHGRAADGAEGPEGAIRVGDTEARLALPNERGETRIGSAPADPLRQRGDVLVTEALPGRHLETAIVNGIDQQAFIRLAGDDDGAGLSAAEQGGTRVEAKVATLLRGPVTGEAVAGQQRAHLLLEKLDLVGR